MINNLKIKISQDKKKGWLIYSNKKDFTKEKIISFLQQNGIIHGLKRSVIKTLLTSKSDSGEVLIAEYTAPLPAVDDKLEILVDTEIKPTETKNKRIDYYNLDFIKDIEKDTKIFNYYEGKEAEDGMLIDGTPIKTDEKRKKLNIWKMTDKNCRLIKKNGGLIEGYSKINGSYIITKNRIALTNKIVINSDLNFKTGNLTSRYSSIEIIGGIKNNFIASSPGDITVSENVENSEIIAQNLFVKKGILKGDKLIHIINSLTAGSISNRKNLYTKFLTVKNEIRNCEIGILEDGNIQSFSGGKLFVNNNLTINILGGEAARNTTVIMGLDKYKQDCLNEIKKKLKKIRALLRIMRKEKVKIKNELDQYKFLKQKEGFINKYDIKIKKLEEENLLFKSDLEEKEKEAFKLLKEHNILSADEFRQNAMIKITEKLHAGVIIKFGLANRIRTRKEYGPCLIKIGTEMEIEIIEDNKTIIDK